MRSRGPEGHRKWLHFSEHSGQVLSWVAGRGATRADSRAHRPQGQGKVAMPVGSGDPTAPLRDANDQPARVASGSCERTFLRQRLGGLLPVELDMFLRYVRDPQMDSSLG